MRGDGEGSMVGGFDGTPRPNSGSGRVGSDVVRMCEVVHQWR